MRNPTLLTIFYHILHSEEKDVLYKPMLVFSSFELVPKLLK